ncbi:BTAD domain-containing putative transcriptional regulator [Streptomyces sp. NPDC059787]|uniref:AfsR/SARP family transcriptional regulator n=1 Tax=Streptomyces sp. NPDC059787 TaxID=3346947 RepID=UPI00365738F6
MSRNGAYLKLLGAFEFKCAGRSAALPLGAKRLLAFLALHRDGVPRTTVAGQLWADCTPSRARANLRTALYYSRQLGSVAAVDSADQRLGLAPWLGVDVHDAWETARQINGSSTRLPAATAELIDSLSRELLPDWSEEWLALARDRWDQVRLHTLESLGQRLKEAGEYLPALETALTAVAIDPIRETAHRLLVEIHLAEGNVASALMRYQQYRRLLLRELNVAPSPRMTQLVQDLMSA